LATLSADERRLSRRLAGLLPLLVSMAFTAIALLPELRPLASVNDDAFHFLLVQGAEDAWLQGGNVVDFWSPVLELGFPQFLYYQHLPHLMVVLLHQLLPAQVDLITVFNGVRYVLLVGLPVTVYWSLRRLGFSSSGSALAAALAPLLSGGFHYGFEYDSYIWRGFGMYTQIWGMHLSFASLGLLADFLERRRGPVWAIAALSALILSHLVYAYMMAISSAVLLVVGLTRRNARERMLRFALVWGVAALVTCYLWVPFLLHEVYLNASPNVPPWKYDSYGAATVLWKLVTGQLLDYGRPPVITILAAIGLIAALRSRTRHSRLATVFFVVWLLLYFGRATWGPLADLLPMSRGLIMHRFIGGVDMGVLMLVAVGADWLGKSLSRWQPKRPVATFCLVALAIMLPALIERGVFFYWNGVMIERTRSAVASDADAAAMIARLKTLPPGRTFAGLRTDWGKEMKIGDLAFSDLLTFNQIPAVSPPYQSLSLNSDLLWDFDYRNLDDYVLFNARYVVAPATRLMPGFLKPLETAGRYSLYEVQSGGYFALGRADIAFGGDISGFLPAIRAWHWSKLPELQIFPAVALNGAVGVPHDLPAFPFSDVQTVMQERPAPPPLKGSILDQSAEPARYSAKVRNQEPATLVLKLTYHPNWHATVDGVPTQTMMVMPSYVGIRLPPGSHEVVVEHVSEPLRNRLLVFGIVVLVLSAAVGLYRRYFSAGARSTTRN
jgi:hypothetical protein